MSATACDIRPCWGCSDRVATTANPPDTCLCPGASWFPVMSLDDRRLAMHAADLTDTYNVREAAVLGGIVRCIIATGGCDVGYISNYVRDILVGFNLVGVDRSAPSAAEIAMVLQRFEEVYGSPFAS